jgi:hypothetical protein
MTVSFQIPAVAQMNQDKRILSRKPPLILPEQQPKKRL